MIKDALAPNPTDALFGSSLTQNMPEKNIATPSIAVHRQRLYTKRTRTSIGKMSSLSTQRRIAAAASGICFTYSLFWKRALSQQKQKRDF